MTKTRTVVGKYIFLDIIGFSRDRTVEAQTDIIKTMNDIVRTSLKEHKITLKQRILIPTGDGMCIALLDMPEPYDIHIQVALALLQKLDSYNKKQEDSMRQFQIRIGINENTDNLIIDVNGNENVAGAGITESQRIMDQGDGANILVGRTVYNHLKQREKYVGRFNEFTAPIKHNQKLEIFQIINEAIDYLNSESPSSLTDIVGMIKSKQRKIKKRFFSKKKTKTSSSVGA